MALSLYILLGVTAHREGSITWLPAQPLTALGLFAVGFVVAFLFSSVLLFFCAEKMFSCRVSERLDFIDGHLGFIVPAFIFICWLPLLIAYFPGVVGYDPNYEIRQFMGYTAFTNHHPPAHTLLLGAFYTLGSGFMFALVLLQVLLFACAVAKVAELMRAFNVRFGLVVAFVVFCTVFCFFPAREISVYKESLYLPFFVLFACAFIEIASLGRRDARVWTELALFGLVLVLVRKDGVFVVVVSCLALLFLKGRGTKIATLTVAVGFLATVGLTNALLWPALGVTNGSRGEAFSVPLQQTVRYLIYHGDDVTPDERAAIADVIDIDKAMEVYDPNSADPVKALWTGQSNEQILGYLRAWASMLPRRPGIYLEAFVQETYGFFLPWPSNLCAHPHDTFQLTPREQNEPNVALGFLLSDDTSFIREGFESYCQLWVTNPALCLLSNPGIYTWVLTFLAVFASAGARRRGAAGLVSLVPGLMVLAFCVLGPVNGYMRYFLPIVPVLPLMACAVFHDGRNEQSGKQPEHFGPRSKNPSATGDRSGNSTIVKDETWRKANA